MKKFKRASITDLQVCQAYRNKQAMAFATEILETETGMPRKIVYAAISRAASRGYIEWGVSLRSGWLTKKGMELVECAQ